MLTQYYDLRKERKLLGIPPLPLDVEQTGQLCDLLIEPKEYPAEELIDLLKNRISPGVDESAKVKAEFLNAIARREIKCGLVSPQDAVDLLGTMIGGYNVQSLVALLQFEDNDISARAVESLSNTLLVFDVFDKVYKLSETNTYAMQLMQNWAKSTWFENMPAVPRSITVSVFKVPGETNTDDLSPAVRATSRPDIPLHALTMLESRMPEGLETISLLKKKGFPVAYVGDVIGTGSSRKSALNSLLWHIGDDIPFVPNKRRGGYILGGNIAPIFYNTAQDAGAFPIECDVTDLNTGDVIVIYPYQGKITRQNGEEVTSFSLSPNTLLDEIKAGGRINLILGRQLTEKARECLELEKTNVFIQPAFLEDTGRGFTLAQKVVGKACGVPGIRPGTYCEPKMTTVGSQDTTGTMTRDELKELACLKFNADLTMQSFCHTAAYPKLIDIHIHEDLPDFISSRGGVSLSPGDGIIHSWINRMVLPDTVGTGGDSHTRFPLGISFPAGSGLVAFGAALGMMPLVMPESVLVRFSGNLQPGITLRDIVNGIPYAAIQQGKLTVDKENKKNVFSGRIMEMEGLPDLKVEQAFELTDATAERSCSAATIKISEDSVAEYLKSNVVLLKGLVNYGYQSSKTLLRRIEKMEEWLAAPKLMSADPDAEYYDVIEVDLDQFKEPIVAAPNDPDDVKFLSECKSDSIDEIFIGSCMTNIGHYRAAAKILEGSGLAKGVLWICPPTRMDEKQLKKEGVYSIFAEAGARTEIPGCSLCMGNQARVKDGAAVFSTSTRNFDNRMGKDAKVYLGSAELAAICALLGRLPSPTEYREIIAEKIDPFKKAIYRYLNFDQIDGFRL